MEREALLKVQMPLRSVEVLSRQQIEQAARQKARADQTEQTRRRLEQVCDALGKAVSVVEHYYASMIAAHREQIVRLSLEIAARVLAKETAEKNYAIEQIVTEVLQSAPPAKQMTIRLNPDDVKAFEQAAGEQGLSLPPTVEVVADWSIGPAACRIDSELGIVESMIEDRLRQIEQALLESEQTE
ncbi:MAG: hypothetical protein GX298_09030 [Planctomycetes bacterium]|jgi:flagellar biosynthesis/type III secretory pathway protein FliH|nr:hypothetical protein [Planctomycetota bacterium]